MRIYEPGEQEQALIDEVIKKAEAQADQLSQTQQAELERLAKRYSHLGEVAVTIVFDAIMNLQEMSKQTSQSLRSNLERRLLPEKPEVVEDIEPIIIEGEVTHVEDIEFEDMDDDEPKQQFRRW